MNRFHCDKCNKVLEEQVIKNPLLGYVRDGTPDIHIKPDLCSSCEFDLWTKVKKLVENYGR